ncbi:hypothetical protein [Caulobacter sp. 17J65-9]|uniref:hypothetical protein n=1 Tax=Caulobacter sp. 17J65-9 TaxID=2709382 RepID=UPI0013CCD436|nr:hypothetical protein [Caulobacter sp. 17J65-9]NEX94917.1 hypothetical protein [Caulobacter sp. 17J65-9]
MKLGETLRSLAALLGCAAVIVVFVDMADRLHWEGWSIRLPAYAILLGCFTPTKNRLITGLQVITVAALTPAAVIALSPALEAMLPSGVQLGLEIAALVALGALCVAQLWNAWWSWRRYRARMKAQYPSPVQRAAGGF